MTDNIVSLDDHRPHDARYVVCMRCVHDWTAVFPVGVNRLECPKCRKLWGEPVQYENVDWFSRFMSGKNRKRRTWVLLNEQRMRVERAKQNGETP